MPHISVKPGDQLTVGGDIVIRLDHVHGNCAHLTVNDDSLEKEHRESAKSMEDIRKDMREFAEDIVDLVSAMDIESGQELLGSFVSELFYAVAQRRQKLSRHQKQANGIAAAQANGVRFGRRARALPDNFDEVHQAWRDNQLTLSQAADACGMPMSSFYDAAVRRSGLKKSPE